MIPDKVHFVGSIALDSVEEVFRTLGSALGSRLRRVPDGEPGGRRLWISWQYPLLRAQPFLKADPNAPNQTTGFLPLSLVDDAKPSEVRFGELGYAREARASYQDFLEARTRGELPPNVGRTVGLGCPVSSSRANSSALFSSASWSVAVGSSVSRSTTMGCSPR